MDLEEGPHHQSDDFGCVSRRGTHSVRQSAELMLLVYCNRGRRQWREFPEPDSPEHQLVRIETSRLERRQCSASRRSFGTLK